jgi:murein L,D-transpeptidase YafK
MMKNIYILSTLIFILLFLMVDNSTENTRLVDSTIDLVKVDKSDRKMYLMFQNQVFKAYQIALGDNPKGHKEQKGDQKTPEG